MPGGPAGMAAAAVAAPAVPLPALSVAHEEQPLIRKILTEQQFGSHVVEITFPAPVVLTSARVGAVPSSAAQPQRAQLLLFAADADAPASARFLQLCPGFEQPESGTRVLQLQPCVTTRVLLRGQYQTVPLSLYGFSLEEGATSAPPLRQRRLTLAGALQWLRDQQAAAEQEQEQEGSAVEPALGAAAAAAASWEAACWQDAPLQPVAEAALAGLVGYWDQVGTSERLMALHPPPPALLKAAAAAADAVCDQLGGGTFGRQPLQVPQPQAAPQPAPGQQQQQGAQAEQAQQEPKQPTPQKAAQPSEQQQQQQAEQSGQAEQQQQQQHQQEAALPPPSTLRGTALLDAAVDLALGWSGLLGGGTKGRTTAAVRCSAAGLAAAVLACSSGEGARVMMARWGLVLLDDVATMPGAPSSFVRYAITACLLVARSCGTAGGAALLGMWKPPRGIVWQSRRLQQMQATARKAAAATAAPGAGHAAPTPGAASADATSTEAAAAEADNADEVAAAAAVEEAAAELEQGLYDDGLPSDGEEEDEEEGGGHGEAAHALLQQKWHHERAAQMVAEEELLYDDGSDEEYAPGYADAAAHPEGEQGDEEEAVEHGEEEEVEDDEEEDDDEDMHAAEEAEPGMGQPEAAPEHQEQEGAGLAAGTSAATAAEVGANPMEVEAEFGADVYAAGADPPSTAALPSPAPHSGAAGSSSGGALAASAGDVEVMPGAEATLGAAAAVDEELDDLYADLGPTIPQTDGAADPSERWEMGDDDDDARGGDHSSRRRRREHSSERGDSRRKERRKDKSKEKRKDRSRERDSRKGKEEKGHRRHERAASGREPSPSRHHDREKHEADEAQRRQRQQEEEDQRRRQRQKEEEEARRRQRQKEEEEARQRRRQEEEERRRRRQQEEEEAWRRRRQQEEEQARQRREDEERRRQQFEEEQRHRRYLEQQRRLEEDMKRLEREEEARRHRQQQQVQKGEAEEARRQRKRERSPAGEPAATGGGARQNGPEGKHPRTEKPGRQQQPQAQRGTDAAGSQQQQPQQPQQPQPVRAPAAATAAAQQPAAQRKRQQRKAAAAPAQPVDEAGRWDLHEQRNLSRMTNYWLLKQREYVGVSAHVARHLLGRVQPQRLAVTARQLLHLLRAHEAAAAFQAAARRLVGAHQQEQGQGQGLPLLGMPTPEASMLVAECGSSLQQLAELLVKPLPTAGSTSSGSGGAPRQPWAPAGSAEPPPPLLDAVRSRRLLPLLAAVLHVPALHRAALEAQLPAGAAAQAGVVEAALAQQLGVGARALLAVLASSRSGRALLLGEAAVLEALLRATDAGCLEAGWQPSPGAEGAAVMQHLVVGEAVAARLCSAGLESEEFAVAAETAAALLRECGPSGRAALLQALALRAPAAVPRLLLMLRMHCALLRAACGTGAAALAAGSAAAAEQQQYEPDLELLLATAPACAPAGHLLLALLTATHPAALACWQQHAVAVQVAASTELRLLAALPEAAAGVVGGLGAARSQLASLKGGVAAVVTAQQSRGLSSLLTYLGAELPALVVPHGGAAPKDDDAGGGRREGVAGTGRTVAWPAVEELFCDPEKLACCEQCLRLLASQLWAPGASGRQAAYTLDAEAGLLVLLRGVLTGAELVTASAADDAWQGLAGLSIDVGEAAACRRRALSFLEAAAAAMSCLLQHLRGSTCVVKSRSLLAGLLRAHAALCCQEESLACMLGGASTEGATAAGAAAAGAAAEGMQGALVARYHLASCLRCYVEAAASWQPPLLQQMFWGTPVPGLEPGQVAAQTPAEMFAAACLLGDLFPPEWPAAGRKATQAPPSDRRYRATLATAIEPCGASFRRLIAAALTSESRLLRAAVVRVLARAAGLGGGMGPFLVEPLLEELATVAESPAPLHDARRLLEVIVPLVYRPALKSAMLAAPFTSTLAQLLGVVVGKLGSADEGVEAAHVCTMAMEVVVVLFNSEVCLNPLAPPKQQQLEDVPPIEEAVPMARALLELLPGMGSNAIIAHRVLRLMAGTDSGCLALRRAVVAIHAAATGAEQPSGHPGMIAVAQAAQWMANRYWAAAERLAASGDDGAAASGGLDGLRTVYVDMVTIMQQICVAIDEDSLPTAPSAQQRFVAALQAALHAAAEAGLDVGGDEHRWEAPGAAKARAADLVYDPATRMFWRNVRARAATQSQASSMHAMRRFARRDCHADPSTSLASSLHPPLTLPRQLPELPPLMERPTQKQQALPMVETEEVPLLPQRGGRQAGFVAGVGGVGASPTAVNGEPAAAAAAAAPDLPHLPSVQPSMDLYADLGSNLQAKGPVQPHPLPSSLPHGIAQGSQQHQQHQQPRPQQQSNVEPPQPAHPPQQVHGVPDAGSAGGRPARQQLEAASAGSLQALLSNPAALQALLKDPAQLQRLLEKHPALISVLKSTLGQS